jgi:hypothetical protein
VFNSNFLNAAIHCIYPGGFGDNSIFSWYNNDACAYTDWQFLKIEEVCFKMTFEQYEELAKLKVSVKGLQARIMGYMRSGGRFGAQAAKFRFLGRTVPIIRIVPYSDAILVRFEGERTSEHHFHYSEIEIVEDPIPLALRCIGPSKIEYNLDSYKKFFEVN